MIGLCFGPGLPSCLGSSPSVSLGNSSLTAISSGISSLVSCCSFRLSSFVSCLGFASFFVLRRDLGRSLDSDFLFRLRFDLLSESSVSRLLRRLSLPRCLSLPRSRFSFCFLLARFFSCFMSACVSSCSASVAWTRSLGGTSTQSSGTSISLPC